MDIIDQTVTDIKSLKIQGATNILNASLKALKTWLSGKDTITPEEFKEKVFLLTSARPTEPLTINLLGMLIAKFANPSKKEAVLAIEDIEVLLSSIEDKIALYGKEQLKEKNAILTHCHSRTIEKIILQTFKENGNLKVYTTETRPMFQGRITATNLAAAGISVNLITDGFAPYLISQNEIKAFIIGADAILSDGSIINKVGSFGIALSAWRENIPVYIACTLLKYVPQELKMESRDSNEIWDSPPSGVTIINPAFDIVPEKFITGLITEAGFLKTSEVTSKIKEIYPWIITSAKM